MKATKTDLSWLAGIVDGEGSYSFQFTKSKSERKFVSSRICFVPQFSLGMIQGKEWEQKLKKIFKKYNIKFGMYSDKRKNYKGKHIVLYTVQRWSNVVKLSKLLYPYLTVKKNHAKLFIDFEGKRPKLIKRAFDGKTFKREIDWKSAYKLINLVEKIRELNGKKQNVKWTKNKIINQLKIAEGESFPAMFVINNPRKR